MDDGADASRKKVHLPFVVRLHFLTPKMQRSNESDHIHMYPVQRGQRR